MLRVVDEYWMDHIDAMDDLKQGIRLRAYGQQRPRRSPTSRNRCEMFEEMIAAIQDETVRRLFSVRLKKDEEVKRERVAKATVRKRGRRRHRRQKAAREGHRRSAATIPAPAAAG